MSVKEDEDDDKRRGKERFRFKKEKGKTSFFHREPRENRKRRFGTRDFSLMLERFFLDFFSSFRTFFSVFQLLLACHWQKQYIRTASMLRPGQSWPEWPAQVALPALSSHWHHSYTVKVWWHMVV